MIAAAAADVCVARNRPPCHAGGSKSSHYFINTKIRKSPTPSRLSLYARHVNSELRLSDLGRSFVSRILLVS